MAMSTRVENFDLMNISAERIGIVMFNLKVRYGLVLGLLVSSVALMVPRSAVGQAAPVFPRKGNGADTGGENGDRPEREQYDNRAFPASDIAPAQQKAAYNA